jgi:DNA-binding transcriptional regulator YiaG
MNLYHYVQCGLDNVWLSNGFNIEATPYGDAVSIDNAEELDRAIAKYLTEKPDPLTGPEVRFLRVMLDMSQKRLGGLLGKEAQTVAIWEKSERVKDEVDFFVRHIYRQVALNSRQTYVELVDYLNAQDRQDHAGNVHFRETSGVWEVAA